MSESGDILNPSLQTDFKPSAILSSETTKPIESYFPRDYPKLLFQGTSRDNSKRAREQGLGGGSLSSRILTSLDSRFYRKEDGALLVMPYDPNTFLTQNEETRGKSPFYYYRIRPKTGPERKVKFTSLDTDGISAGGLEAVTDRYVDPKNIGSLTITADQINFLGYFDAILFGHYIKDLLPERQEQTIRLLVRAGLDPRNLKGITMQDESRAGIAPEASFNLQQFQKQQELAVLLGIKREDFSDWNTFQKSMDQQFPTEDIFLDRVLSQFPGKLKWQWKNLQMDDKDIIRQAALQIYQTGIINKIYDTQEGYQRKSYMFRQGESAQGYFELQKEKATFI